MNNIAIIITDITRRAGTERAVINLANIQINSGNKVYIISTDSKEGNPAFPYNKKINTFHLGLGISKYPGLRKISEYRKLYKYIIDLYKENIIDTIIGTYSSINCLIAVLPKEIKKIGCEHFNYGSASFLRRLIRRCLYTRLDATVLLTPSDINKYNFVKNNKLFVIPNSLSFPIRNYHTYENKQIIAIGRLTKQKGFDFLIKIASKVQSYIPDWNIKIIGDGEEKEMLNKMIEKFGLKDFINICPPTNDVIKEYLNSSIYVMTSRFEGLPMVLIEAQACGLPIISFDCPTGPSFIIKDNVSGYLVEPGKIDLFAKKLIDLANDNLLIKNFGNAALKNAKKYSPEEISKLWNSLFIQLSGGTNYDS